MKYLHEGSYAHCSSAERGRMLIRIVGASALVVLLYKVAGTFQGSMFNLDICKCVWTFDGIRKYNEF